MKKDDSRSVLELTPDQFAEISDSKASALIEFANARQRRQAWYAALGMTCGTASFLSCVGAFVYLVMNGHPQEGYVALGTAVLALIGRMIKSRL